MVKRLFKKKIGNISKIRNNTLQFFIGKFFFKFQYLKITF
ncbi:unnamed protein product [Schistosoma curassoni]|uniref:Uncharacterized protein n=1 Tax=Schistosoma curassoni TaxID=6186 RepID=A0A183JSG2_9TREM|nr:unnamed protein product [Schistosoma curassoni]